MLFDTHAHYDDKRFDSDRAELLGQMAENGVGLIINPGCDVESCRKVLAYTAAYPFVYGALGFHPENLNGLTEADFDWLKTQLIQPKIVAIGEIGLDYYWKEVPREVQQNWLEKQFALAEEYNLPVIFHDREAHGDSMEMVRRFPKVRGVFHCYSGSAEMAAELVERGWYLSFTGVITFGNSKKAAAVIEQTPLERLFIETDSPYMAPEPYRGRRNSSLYVYRMAERIAEIKGLSRQQVEDATTRNAKAFFGIA